MKVICISGKSGSGKDTTAEIMRKELCNDGHKVIIMHFADLLKYICRTFCNWNGEKDEAGRSLLQTVGTNIRKRHFDYWVGFIVDMLIFFGDSWDYVIIADHRYPNEFEVLKQAGKQWNFDVVSVETVRENYVNNLTTEQQLHESETALNDFIRDFQIINEGSLDDLRTKIKTWITEDLYGIY